MQNAMPPSPTLPILLLPRDTAVPDGTVLVFDAMCQLWPYVATRFPGLMNSFRCLIDRFHATNHTWCSSDYHAESFKDKATLELNTSAAEQTNESVLLPIKKQLLYSKASNALLLINVAIARHNLDKLTRMRK